MSKLSWGTRAYGVFLLATVAVALPAQTFTTLHSFDGTDGSNSMAPLVQATNGDLYGTTSAGGVHKDGTVFEITTNGTLTTLHNFSHLSPIDGAEPYGGLIQAKDGNLYGTTTRGGFHNAGIFFRITTSGTMRAIHDFDYSPDGALPYAGVVQATNGAFYGTAPDGGGGAGTVYEVTPFGQLVALYDFGAHGASPTAGLVQASNGNFYGTASTGGFYSCGTIFEITPNGAFTFLHDFTGGDGCYPYATLVQGSDGNLYGTAIAGGAHNGYNAGTFFKITPSGTFTLLHVFDKTDGAGPSGALVQPGDGNFYGTTYAGGAYGKGTIFKVTPSGTVTTLYSFCPQSGCSDGSGPSAGLVLASDGNFYGTTVNGGAYNDGTVFSLSVDLNSIVKISK
jgi:uncharacterized repeat protein (TIGR03803 family)